MIVHKRVEFIERNAKSTTPQGCRIIKIFTLPKLCMLNRSFHPKTSKFNRQLKSLQLISFVGLSERKGITSAGGNCLLHSEGKQGIAWIDKLWKFEKLKASPFTCCFVPSKNCGWTAVQTFPLQAINQRSDSRDFYYPWRGGERLKARISKVLK